MKRPRKKEKYQDIELVVGLGWGGAIVTVLLSVELFFYKDKEAIRTFLYQLKALGYGTS